MKFAAVVVGVLGCGPGLKVEPATHDVARVESGVDPYRWMETETAERDAWLEAHSASTAKAFKAMPKDGLEQRAHQLGGGSSVGRALLRHGRLLFKHSGALVTRDASGTDRALVVPEREEVTDYSMSPDASLVCYSLSRDGVQTLHVLEAATGKPLPDVEQDVGGACSWLHDGQRFYYVSKGATRVHALGQPTDQDLTILDRTANSPLALTANETAWLYPVEHSSKSIATIVTNHDEVRVALSPVNPFDRAAPWQIVAGTADRVDVNFVHGDRLYLVTDKDAPNRKLVSVPLANPDLAQARTEVAEDPDAVIGEIGNGSDAVYFVRRDHGHARLMRWPWSGAPTAVSLPIDGWVSDLTPDEEAQGLVFRIDSYLHASAYYVYDPVAVTVTPIGVSDTVSSSANTSDIAVDNVEVRNGDVTVPLTIIHQRSAKLDGSHPTILSAHGAYGYIERPGFLGATFAWIEHGGVYAYAHVRGDGDKGIRWRDAGSREHKLDGVGDLIACADYLVSQHWTAPSRLGLKGHDIGGIVVGRALTLRPELFAAVSIDFAVLDPARLGVDSTDITDELGDPSTDEGMKSLAAMDPYQHVVPGTRYPAVLLATGLEDPRVAPWHTAKFAARLLASSTSGRPILVRVNPHGRSSYHGLDWELAMWRFMLSQFR